MEKMTKEEAIKMHEEEKIDYIIHVLSSDWSMHEKIDALTHLLPIQCKDCSFWIERLGYGKIRNGQCSYGNGYTGSEAFCSNAKLKKEKAK